MIAIKARKHCSGDFALCWNHPEAAHIPGRYPALTKRYLQPPRRTPLGGINERENFQYCKPVHGHSMRQRRSAIDATTGQVMRRYRNPGMPMRRGRGPQERQILRKKRTQGRDFKKERIEIEGAHT